MWIFILFMESELGMHQHLSKNLRDSCWISRHLIG